MYRFVKSEYNYYKISSFLDKEFELSSTILTWT